MQTSNASEDGNCGLRRTHRKRLDSCFGLNVNGIDLASHSGSGCGIDASAKVSPKAYARDSHSDFFADECPICRDRDVSIERRRQRLLTSN